LERIAAIGRPKSIHVHDFAGRFDRYGQLYTQTRITDVPADVLTAGRDAVARRVEAALGADHAGYRDLYFLLLGLSSHDLAIMRGAFGTPNRVVHAQQTGPNQLLAVLDYGGVPCLFDMALAQYEWWASGSMCMASATRCGSNSRTPTTAMPRRPSGYAKQLVKPRPNVS
jgi:hypothetical protein